MTIEKIKRSAKKREVKEWERELKKRIEKREKTYDGRKKLTNVDLEKQKNGDIIKEWKNK